MINSFVTAFVIPDNGTPLMLGTPLVILESCFLDMFCDLFVGLVQEILGRCLHLGRIEHNYS